MARRCDEVEKGLSGSGVSRLMESRSDYARRGFATDIEMLGKTLQPESDATELGSLAEVKVVTRAGGLFPLPALLAREALVQESQDLRHIELHVFKVQIFLAVFLHLQQIVQLQIEFQQTSSTPWGSISSP